MAARRPSGKDLVGDAADLPHGQPSVRVGRDPADAESGGELAFQHGAVERAGGVGVAVDRLGVDGAPHAVAAVDAVEDGAVGVQLGVADAGSGIGRAGGAVAELGDDEPVRVDPSEAAGAGAGVTGVVLEVAESVVDGGVVGVEDGLADDLGRVRRPQRRHGLRRRERDVERGERFRDVLARRPGVDDPRRHLPAEHDLGATRRAGIDEPPVQGVHVTHVDHPGEPELGGPRPRPHARRLTAPGVVVVLRRGDLVGEVPVAGAGGDPSDGGDHGRTMRTWPPRGPAIRGTL